MYYQSESFLTTPIGNNAIDFENRKKIGSDSILRIPPMITGTLDDVRLFSPLKKHPFGYKEVGGICYEYISDSGKLISSSGLQNLIEITHYQGKKDNLKSKIQNPKSLFIIDNHNHAFYCRYKSYLKGHLPRGSHLIHIDQHSDLNEAKTSPSLPLPLTGYLHYAPSSLREGCPQDTSKEESPSPSGRGVGVRLTTIATYTNEILDIASFIKPAKACGLISNYEMILTEHSLITYQIGTLNSELSTIVDIDLDFRAPEMSIEHYDQTIRQVKKLIALPQTKCITIATSPTYIDQERALEILKNILE